MQKWQYYSLITCSTIPIFYLFNPSFAIWYGISSVSYYTLENIIKIRDNEDKYLLTALLGAFVTLFNYFSTLAFISEITLGFIVDKILSELMIFDIILALITFQPLYTFSFFFILTYTGSIFYTPLFLNFPISEINAFLASSIASLFSFLASTYYRDLMLLFNKFYSLDPIEVQETIIKAIAFDIIEEKDIPEKFNCGISFEIMTAPCYASFNPTVKYDFENICKWLNEHSNDPFTRKHTVLDDIVFDYELCNEIKEYINNLKLRLNEISPENLLNIALRKNLINDIDIPSEYFCSINIKEIMKTPAYDRNFPEIKYEFEYISDWVQKSHKNPLSNAPFRKEDIIIDTQLQSEINLFSQDLLKQFNSKLFDNSNQQSYRP